MNNNKFVYEFRGTDVSRKTFLHEFEGALIDFMGADNGFLMFTREIVKNIYDHASGRGNATFLKDIDGSITFKIMDYGTEEYDLEIIKARGTSKSGNGINFGLGICQDLIADMALGLGINYTLDTSHGFCYTGVYKH